MPKETPEFEEPAFEKAAPERRAEPKHLLDYAVFAFVVLAFLAATASAWYAREQSISAYVQANTAIDYEKRSLRAYVSIYFDENELGNVIPPPPQKVLVRAHLHDDGLTPASHVKYVARVFISAPLSSENGIDLVTDPSPPRDLVPGSSEKDLTLYKNLSYRDSKSLSPEEYSKLLTNGGEFLYFIGTVTYKDVFDLDHITNFCFQFTHFYDENKTHVTHKTLCDFHNSMD